MTYDNTNKGVLFSNDKQGNERRPDWKGKINIDGVERKLSGWFRTGPKGEYITLSADPIVEAHAGPTRAASVKHDPFDDSIPF